MRTELNGRAQVERTGRSGRLILAARPGPDGLDTHLWWDSLAVWRDAGGTHTAPETLGMLGGRYVGTLGAHGSWRTAQLPFIPDDVAAIADLTGVPDDLLPLLPPDSLVIGRTWTDSMGTSMTRLTDSIGSGHPVARYRITRTKDHEEDRNIGGPRPAHVSDRETETGELVWDQALGPWRWERSIVAETRVVADPGKSFRSRLEQRIVLQRVVAGPEVCTQG